MDANTHTGNIDPMYTFATAATTYLVYPCLTSLRVHWGISLDCLTGRKSMRAFADDA